MPSIVHGVTLHEIEYEQLKDVCHGPVEKDRRPPEQADVNAHTNLHCTHSFTTQVLGLCGFNNIIAGNQR